MDMLKIIVMILQVILIICVVIACIVFIRYRSELRTSKQAGKKIIPSILKEWPPDWVILSVGSKTGTSHSMGLSDTQKHGSFNKLVKNIQEFLDLMEYDWDLFKLSMTKKETKHPKDGKNYIFSNPENEKAKTPYEFGKSDREILEGGRNCTLRSLADSGRFREILDEQAKNLASLKSPFEHIQFRPLDEIGYLMDIHEFKDGCHGGLFTDEDGYAFYATHNEQVNIKIKPSQYKGLDMRFTHIKWYQQ